MQQPRLADRVPDLSFEHESGAFREGRNEFVGVAGGLGEGPARVDAAEPLHVLVDPVGAARGSEVRLERVEPFGIRKPVCPVELSTGP